jgi:hypothetical protein
MTRKKELNAIYGGKRPKGYLLAHNHVMHTNATRHGTRGFRRFWIPPQWVGDNWEECPCGWHNGDTHYARKDHIVVWREDLNRLGSLEAVYAEYDKELAAHELPYH